MRPAPQFRCLLMHPAAESEPVLHHRLRSKNKKFFGDVDRLFKQHFRHRKVAEAHAKQFSALRSCIIGVCRENNAALGFSPGHPRLGFQNHSAADLPGGIAGPFRGPHDHAAGNFNPVLREQRLSLIFMQAGQAVLPSSGKRGSVSQPPRSRGADHFKIRQPPSSRQQSHPHDGGMTLPTQFRRKLP
jgi:hypothetical protein